MDELVPALFFAWEADVEDGFFNTIALVVITYSFPFFNRLIDRQIISNMPNLKKEYFQAPDALNLIERFKAIKENIKSIELVSIPNTELFILPNEP